MQRRATGLRAMWPTIFVPVLVDLFTNIEGKATSSSC
jgi:hypothetical protein